MRRRNQIDEVHTNTKKQVYLKRWQNEKSKSNWIATVDQVIMLVAAVPVAAEKNTVAGVAAAVVAEGAGVVTDEIEGIGIDTIPVAVEIEVPIEAEVENDVDVEVEVEVQKDVEIEVVHRTGAIHQEEAEDENWIPYIATVTSL